MDVAPPEPVSPRLCMTWNLTSSGVFEDICRHLRRHLRMFLIITRTLEAFGAFCISLPHLASKFDASIRCPFESALLCLFNFLASLRPTSANRSTSRDWCEGQLWKVEPACTRTYQDKQSWGSPQCSKGDARIFRAYWSYYSYFRVLESHSAFCATTWCCVVKCTLPNVSLPPEEGRVFTDINHIFNIYISII